MPGIFDGLFIGKSGLYVNQESMNVTGNNVANVNTPGYTRERVEIVSSIPMFTHPGTFGTGAEVYQIVSARNDLIDKRTRAAYMDESFYNTMNSALDDVQNVFNEENNVGLKGAMDEFFNAWHALALNPDLETARQQVLEKGKTLSDSINASHNSLSEIRNGLDEQTGYIAQQINSLSKRIADLNYEIKKGELGKNDHANSLRDERGVLLDKLSKLANVTILEGSYNSQTKPEMTVLLGGMPIVSGTTYNKITAEKLNGEQFNKIYFVDSAGNKQDITMRIKGGQLGATLKLRDNIIPTYQKDIDNIAKTLIQEVNKIHAAGTGLTAYSQVVGAYRIKDSNAVVSSSDATGLDMPIQTGSFRVKVTDDNGNDIGTYTVKVNSSDTFNDIVDKFNAELNQYATMNISSSQNGNVQIVAQNGYKVSFTYDSSHFLAATGINTFFTGHSAKDMRVSSVLQNDPSKIAAGKTLKPGDSSNAEAVAQLQLKKVMVNSTQSIDEYYNAFLGTIGSAKQRYDSIYKAKQATVHQLETTKQSLEGVSLDEEAANLIKFQRAYQANAKFISVIDDMTQTLLNMVK